MATLIITNSEKYGGLGYPPINAAVMTANPKAFTDIGMHELSHGLFNLADEYSYGPTGTNGPSVSPNCDHCSFNPDAITAECKQQNTCLAHGPDDCTKWRDLLDARQKAKSLDVDLFQDVVCAPGYCHMSGFCTGLHRGLMFQVAGNMGSVNERISCCNYLVELQVLPPYCAPYDDSRFGLDIVDFCAQEDGDENGDALVMTKNGSWLKRFDETPIGQMDSFLEEQETSSSAKTKKAKNEDDNEDPLSPMTYLNPETNHVKIRLAPVSIMDSKNANLDPNDPTDPLHARHHLLHQNFYHGRQPTIAELEQAHLHMKTQFDDEALPTVLELQKDLALDSPPAHPAERNTILGVGDGKMVFVQRPVEWSLTREDEDSPWQCKQLIVGRERPVVGELHAVGQTKSPTSEDDFVVSAEHNEGKTSKQTADLIPDSLKQRQARGIRATSHISCDEEKLFHSNQHMLPTGKGFDLQNYNPTEPYCRSNGRTDADGWVRNSAISKVVPVKADWASVGAFFADPKMPTDTVKATLKVDWLVNKPRSKATLCIINFRTRSVETGLEHLDLEKQEQLEKQMMDNQAAAGVPQFSPYPSAAQIEMANSPFISAEEREKAQEIKKNCFAAVHYVNEIHMATMFVENDENDRPDNFSPGDPSVKLRTESDAVLEKEMARKAKVEFLKKEVQWSLFPWFDQAEYTNDNFKCEVACDIIPECILYSYHPDELGDHEHSCRLYGKGVEITKMQPPLEFEFTTKNDEIMPQEYPTSVVRSSQCVRRLCDLVERAENIVVGQNFLTEGSAFEKLDCARPVDCQMSGWTTEDVEATAADAADLEKYAVPESWTNSVLIKWKRSWCSEIEERMQLLGGGPLGRNYILHTVNATDNMSRPAELLKRLQAGEIAFTRPQDEDDHEGLTEQFREKISLNPKADSDLAWSFRDETPNARICRILCDLVDSCTAYTHDKTAELCDLKD
ncbi:unnamed protein product, partial [Amoebophrya sp. A120]|eukprot:GSA120T00021241001.1